MPNKKRECIIIANGCSHSKNSGEQFHMAYLYLLAYVDLQNPTTIKNPDFPSSDSDDFNSLHWYVDTDKNIEQSRLRFAKHGIYKVTIEEKIFDGKYGLYFIVDNSEAIVENKVLADFLSDYNKPTIIEDELLGTLVAENAGASLSGNIMWNNIDLNISLDIEAIDKMKELVGSSKSWNEKFSTALSEEFFESAKQYFEGGQKSMSKEQFAQYFILERLYIDEQGEFYASFNSKIYLPDHNLEVNGSLDEGISNISLEG